MTTITSFLLGLLSGIIASLFVENSRLRFKAEKFVRKIIKKPIISMKLKSFEKRCNDGGVLSHCIEIENNMWFTQSISNCFLKTHGFFSAGQWAYKPMIYFRSDGMDSYELEKGLTEVMDELSSTILPYKPGGTSLGFNLRKGISLRIVVLCEKIDGRLESDEPLNHQKILGDLYFPICNPMVKIDLGTVAGTAIISENLGFVDGFKIEVPEDLNKDRPFYDSMVFLRKKNRRPCLHDVGLPSNTWPLRFLIDDLKISLNGDNQIEKAKVFIEKKTNEKELRLKQKIEVKTSTLMNSLKERKKKDLFSIKKLKQLLKTSNKKVKKRSRFYYMEGLKIK